MSAILPKTFYFTKWKLYKQHDISRILNSPYCEKSYKLIKNKKKIHLKLRQDVLLNYMHCTTKTPKSSTFEYLKRSYYGIKS